MKYILSFINKYLDLKLNEEKIILGAKKGVSLCKQKENRKPPEGSSLPTDERTRRKNTLKPKFERITLCRNLISYTKLIPLVN